MSLKTNEICNLAMWHVLSTYFMYYPQKLVAIADTGSLFTRCIGIIRFLKRLKTVLYQIKEKKKIINKI